jgi:AAA+ ATPase superfamily predicted ATPase
MIVSAERTLAAELPRSAHARATLTAIGAGARAHKDIAIRTGLSGTVLDQAFAILLEKRIVQRLTPYSTKPAPKTRQWVVRDPYLRFWLRFIDERIELIERGRGQLLLDELERSWPSYRGQAIEPVVRETIERLLPAAHYGTARHVGSYWTRNHQVEVDLVGGDRTPVASEIGFIGTIKWRTLDRSDTAHLQAHRAHVPGADTAPLIGVAHSFAKNVQLDHTLTPGQLIDAWR